MVSLSKTTRPLYQIFLSKTIDQRALIWERVARTCAVTDAQGLPIVRKEPSHETEGIANSQVALLRRSNAREGSLRAVSFNAHSDTVLKPCLVLVAYIGAHAQSNLVRHSLSSAIAPTLG